MCNITITFYCAKEFSIDVKLYSKKIKFSTKIYALLSVVLF